MAYTKYMAALVLCAFSVGADAALLRFDFTAENGPGDTDICYGANACPGTTLTASYTVDTLAVHQSTTYTAGGYLTGYEFRGVTVGDVSVIIDGIDRWGGDEPAAGSFYGTQPGTTYPYYSANQSVQGGAVNWMSASYTVTPVLTAGDVFNPDPLAVILLSQGSFYGFRRFDVSDVYTYSAIFETQGWTTVSAIPIPAAVYLFGSALGLMGVMRRKISR